MLRRWLLYGAWGVAVALLAGAGLWRASTAPPTRTEVRKTYLGDVVINAGWDWTILIGDGNALWPAGTVLQAEQAARAYPLAGKPVLRAVPKVEVRVPEGEDAVASVSAEAVLKVTSGDVEVWQKRLDGLEVKLRGSEGSYTGQALSVDVAEARAELEKINKALGLLERYEGRLVFGLRAEMSGNVTGELSVAAPVVLQPDIFSPAPADKWRGQARIPLMRIKLRIDNKEARFA